MNSAMTARARGHVAELATMVAVGVGLAALGPFDSYAMGSFAVRLAYWLPLTLAAFAIFRPLAFLAERAAARLGFSKVAALVVAVLLAGWPMTLVVVLAGGASLTALPGFAALFGVYEHVVIVGGMVTFGLVMLDGRRAEHDQREALIAAERKRRDVPFIRRLPPGWRGMLIALEMEDHYVRAHGPEGRSELFLMRMADAEAELEGFDGLRVHRSWWVAREAVEQTLRDGRNWRLRLAGGLDAPVARNRVAALREAGWI